MNNTLQTNQRFQKLKKILTRHVINQCLSSSPEFFLVPLAIPTTLMAWFECYQITSRPINQAICILLFLPIVFCDLVSTKIIVIITAYF